MDRQDAYDAVIVGGGVAGLSAALVLGRARRRVAVIDDGSPRNAPAHAAFGFTTRDGVRPGDLVDLARQDLDPYGVTFIDGRAEAAQDDGTDWIVRTADGASVRGRHVVVATGLRDELPGIGGARAGTTDMSTLGSPAKVGCCTAESAAGPWPSLAVRRGLPDGAAAAAETAQAVAEAAGDE